MIAQLKKKLFPKTQTRRRETVQPAARQQLRSIIFETTTDCNHQCRYCYNIGKAPGCETMRQNSFAKAKAALERLFELADVKQVTMTGGEPFLAERFLDLVQLVRERGPMVSLISNGSANLADYRKALELGVRLFQLPLHSPHPAEHDAMTRVQGSWLRSLGAIRELTRCGATVVPVIVLTKFNAASVGPTLLLIKQLGLQRVMLNRFNVGGAGILHRAEITPSIEELRAAFAVANDSAAKRGFKLSSNVCTPMCVLDPRDYPRIGFSYCSSAMERRPLTLDIEGNLRFCNHSPVVMGNIFEQTLETILSSPYACSWREQTPSFCQGCAVYDRCQGGCRAASEQLGLGNGHVDPIVEQLESQPWGKSNHPLPDWMTQAAVGENQGARRVRAELKEKHP